MPCPSPCPSPCSQDGRRQRDLRQVHLLPEQGGLRWRLSWRAELAAPAWHRIAAPASPRACPAPSAAPCRSPHPLTFRLAALSRSVRAHGRTRGFQPAPPRPAPPCPCAGVHRRRHRHGPYVQHRAAFHQFQVCAGVWGGGGALNSAAGGGGAFFPRHHHVMAGAGKAAARCQRTPPHASPSPARRALPAAPPLPPHPPPASPSSSLLLGWYSSPALLPQRQPGLQVLCRRALGGRHLHRRAGCAPCWPSFPVSLPALCHCRPCASAAALRLCCPAPLPATGAPCCLEDPAAAAACLPCFLSLPPAPVLPCTVHRPFLPSTTTTPAPPRPCAACPSSPFTTPPPPPPHPSLPAAGSSIALNQLPPESVAAIYPRASNTLQYSVPPPAPAPPPIYAPPFQVGWPPAAAAGRTHRHPPVHCHSTAQHSTAQHSAAAAGVCPCRRQPPGAVARRAALRSAILPALPPPPVPAAPSLPGAGASAARPRARTSSQVSQPAACAAAAPASPRPCLRLACRAPSPLPPTARRCRGAHSAGCPANPVLPRRRSSHAHLPPSAACRSPPSPPPRPPPGPPTPPLGLYLKSTPIMWAPIVLT